MRSEQKRVLRGSFLKSPLRLGLCLLFSLAQIGLAAEPPGSEPRQYWLDFGSADSPVWEGFERVTPDNVLGESSLYGFFSHDALYAHSLAAPDPLAADFVTGNLWQPYRYSFGLHLPDGRYAIRLIARHVSPARIATRSGRIAAAGQEVYRRLVEPETFYSEAMLYRGLARPYRLGQDAWEKYFSPDLDWIAFEVDASRGRLNLTVDNLALFALVVFPAADTVPVEQRLRRIDEERKRYFYERVYRERRVEPARYEPTPEEAQRGFAARLIPPWQTVWPWSRPGDLPGTAEARLVVARGEWEPFTIAVFPLRDLPKLSVQVREATGEEGVLLSRDQFDVRLVQYRETRQEDGRYVPTESYMTAVRAPVSLQEGLAQRLWITLRVPEHLPAGTYRTGIRLGDEAGPSLTLPVEIEVLPLVLPDRSGLAVGWYCQDPGRFNYHFDHFPQMSTRRATMIERELRDMKAHGCTTFQLPDPVIRSLTERGKMDFDSSVWNAYVEAAHRCRLGLEHPPQTLVINLANRLRQQGAEEGTETFGFAYSSALRQLAAWSREHSFPLVFWVVDAPQEEGGNSWNRNLTQTRFLLQKAKSLPGVKTTATLLADFDGSTDYTVLLDDLDVLQARPWANSGRMVRRAKVRGIPVWLYGAEVDRISFGFYPWAVEAQGRWQWHYAYWSDPYNIFVQGWGVTFPSPEGPLPTPGYERTREGTEDYRWLEVLAERLAGQPEHPAAADARRLLESIRKEIPDYLEAASAPGGAVQEKLEAKLPQWREEILRAIVQLEQPLGVDSGGNG